MKKIIVLLFVSACVFMSYAARVTYQGATLTATTTTNLYQIGSSNSDFATEVSINVIGSETVYVLPNVGTNDVVNPIPVRAGFPYTMDGDNIFWITYYTTNATSEVDISCEGY